MCKKESSSFLTGALIGAALGAAAGFLFAPKPGKETRKELKEKGQKYWETGKLNYDRAYNMAQEAVDEIREKIGRLVDDVENKIEEEKKNKKRMFNGLK